MTDLQPGLNDKVRKKLLLMTLVVITVYILLGIIGFFLWFAFPVEIKDGLSYITGNSLIYYYIIVNFMDIAGILFLSHFIYFRFIHTSNPVKDAIYLGLMLIIFSWLIDLFVYVSIRKTLPSIQEYFFGKNQPEIGIAWLTAFISSLCSGYLHLENKQFVKKLNFPKLVRYVIWLGIGSTILTVVGISFFDIKP